MVGRKTSKQTDATLHDAQGVGSRGHVRLQQEHVRLAPNPHQELRTVSGCGVVVYKLKSEGVSQAQGVVCESYSVPGNW